MTDIGEELISDAIHKAYVLADISIYNDILYIINMSLSNKLLLPINLLLRMKKPMQ